MQAQDFDAGALVKRKMEKHAIAALIMTSLERWMLGAPPILAQREESVVRGRNQSVTWARVRAGETHIYVHAGMLTGIRSFAVGPTWGANNRPAHTFFDLNEAVEYLSRLIELGCAKCD